MAKVIHSTPNEETLIQDLTPEEKNFPPLNFDYSEEFEKQLASLNETDKLFVKVRRAMTTISLMNIVEGHRNDLSKTIMSCFPNQQDETIKIILARINDIKPDSIKELSMGFIKNLLTVDGKETTIKLPKKLGNNDDVKHLDPLAYHRVAIGLVYAVSVQIEAANKWLKESRLGIETKIEPEIKQIIASPDKTNEYIENYLKAKRDDPETPKETAESIGLTLKYSEYGTTLDPIMQQIVAQKERNKNLVSLMHNFRHKSSNVTTQAFRNCKSMGITYPKEMICNIEHKLFGDEYKNIEFMFSYLVARYIKYKGDSLDKYEKIFIMQLFSNVVQIMRSSDDPEKDTCKQLKDKMKPKIKELLDYVVKYSIAK